jgi:hypothetical protein
VIKSAAMNSPAVNCCSAYKKNPKALCRDGFFSTRIKYGHLEPAPFKVLQMVMWEFFVWKIVNFDGLHAHSNYDVGKL